MKRFARYTVLLLLVGIFAAGLGACGDPEEPTPPKAIANRTVLVYQVADNSLGRGNYDRMDIAEMVKGATNGKIKNNGRLLVYNSSPSADDILMEISKDGIDTIKTYSTPYYSVQSERMLEVFDDMQQFAPAMNYGLVLWSHGSGWLQNGIEDNIDAKPLSFGEEHGRSMNITTLAKVLDKGPTFSFLYFDCCYMGSVETLYELRKSSPVIVASATELPVYGMPYDQNLEHFFASGNADMISAAKNTYNYYNSLNGMSRTCTMCVINTSALEILATATRDIYSKCNPEWPEGYTPQRFMNYGISSCTYFDFENYVRALCFDMEGNERFDNAGELFTKFSDALSSVVTYAAATPKLWDTVPLTYHCGISTYILTSPVMAEKENYNTLSWYNDIVRSLQF